MPICLHMVCGYFCVTMAESNSCNRDHVAYKTENMYYLAPFRKSLLTPGKIIWQSFLNWDHFYRHNQKEDKHFVVFTALYTMGHGFN